MLRTLLRKLLGAVFTLLCATLLLFVLIRAAPGDPIRLLLGVTSDVAMSDTTAYERRVAELREQLGLDRGVAAQYTDWLGRLVRLDLGTSIRTGQEIVPELAQRLSATALLAASALAIQVALGLGLGIWSALRAGRWQDHAIRIACVGLASAPPFVVGLSLLSLLAVTLHVYEIGSGTGPGRLWLPALTLGAMGAPSFVRVVRANLLSELGQTYVTAALARGLGRRTIVLYALRNALLPVVTLTALSLTALVSGAAVIESVFAWPGIGKYALDSILTKDYPALQGYALFTVSAVIVIHLLADVVYALVDPRIRRREASEVG